MELRQNEPCHCGSGKKFKRCHGAKPVETLASNAQAEAMPKFDPSAFDPSKMDPQMMAQMSQALQRLPRGQLQRLQAIMQRAMAGKDISKEAQELERLLPPQFQELIKAQMGAAMMGAGGGFGGMPQGSGSSDQGMTEEEARKIVAEAQKEGKLSEEQASELLSQSPSQKSGFFSKLFKKS